MTAQAPLGHSAPELLLGLERPRPYGFRQEGVVIHDGIETEVTVRSPLENSDSIYLYGNGWTGDRNSMRRPALEAVHAGHTAITFGYTNISGEDALAKNAAEMAAIIDALPEKQPRRVVGLSMSGRVMAKALERVNTPVQVATFMSPAGFLLRDPSKLEIAEHFLAEGAELAMHYWKDPIDMAVLAYSSAKHVLRRLPAIKAEIQELTHGSVHDTIHAIKAKPDSPFLRFAYASGDKLIPDDAQEEGIIDVPFDDIWKYPGEHVEAIFTSRVSRELLERDAHLQTRDPLPTAA